VVAHCTSARVSFRGFRAYLVMRWKVRPSGPSRKVKKRECGVGMFFSRPANRAQEKKFVMCKLTCVLKQVFQNYYYANFPRPMDCSSLIAPAPRPSWGNSAFLIKYQRCRHKKRVQTQEVCVCVSACEREPTSTKIHETRTVEVYVSPHEKVPVKNVHAFRQCMPTESCVAAARARQRRLEEGRGMQRVAPSPARRGERPREHVGPLFGDEDWVLAHLLHC
jgi:hypothetical protein